MQDRFISPEKLPLTDEVSKELEHIWKGKKDTMLPVYTAVAEKPGGSFVGSIYEKEKSSTANKTPLKPKSRWLGKLGSTNTDLTSNQTLSISRQHRGANRDAVKEKIASDFYYVLASMSDFAFDVPKARLAELSIMNSFTEKNALAQEIVKLLNEDRPPEKHITKSVHIMSKWVNGYHDLSEAQVSTPDGKIKPYLDYLKETNCLSDTIFVKGKNIPLEGLLELLAAARLLGDVDVLGNGGSNTGFVVQENLRGIPISAKIVKVDPGYAFTVEQESLLFATLYPPTNPLSKPRTLKDTKDIQIGTTTDLIVSWSFLTKEQKSRFLKTMKHGINTLKQDSVMHYMLSRNDHFNMYKDHCLMTENNIKDYSDKLTLLLEKQEEIYGKLFIEIIPDIRELFERLKETSEQEINQLKQNLQNKEKTIQDQQQQLLKQDQTLQNKDQQLQMYMQQLQAKESEVQVQKQKVMVLSAEFHQKDLEAAQLKAKIHQLENALQTANESELHLKQQLNETQKAIQPASNKGWFSRLFMPVVTQSTSPVSPLKPNEPTLSYYAKQVEVMAKTVEDKIEPKELVDLFKWVTEGHLEEVEELLKKSPRLVLGMGTVKDLSDRTFNDITALQYAAWALDKEMCELIMQYADGHNSAIQLKALWETPERYSTYGASYDITPLITKTETYLNNHGMWSDDECRRYWQKEVGGAQRKCPAWLIYAWCESGSNVAWTKTWTKQDFNRKVKREYDKHWLDWWFTESCNNGKGVGSSWAVGRGPIDQPSSRVGDEVRKGDLFVGIYERGDLWSQQTLKQHGLEVLANLKATSDKLLSGDILASTTVTTITTTTTTTTASIIQIPLIQVTAHPSVFNQSPKPTMLGYVQQVEAMAKVVQDKIDQKELSALLKDVTEGHLVNVENRLKKLPVLALGIGTVTDLSDRTFNNITALQYAAWALDQEMCDLIMQYAGVHNSAIQLKALFDEPAYYSSHGASYDISPLINKTKTYLDNNDSDNYHEFNYEEQCHYWQKEVGGEQRKCPAWLIYAWCEEGKNVAWAKQDFTRKVKREYNKHWLAWWFTQNYNNGRGVGSTWASVRGTWSDVYDLKGLDGVTLARGFDLAILNDNYSQNILSQRAMEFLAYLKTTIETELKQDAQIPNPKPPTFSPQNS